MSERLDSMNYLTMNEEEELKDAGLKTMLIVIGGYLYAGAELEEVDDGTYSRLIKLLIKHVNREIEEPPEDAVIH